MNTTILVLFIILNAIILLFAIAKLLQYYSMWKAKRTAKRILKDFNAKIDDLK